MQAISAADLITPAIKRTRWFLFEPFRWGTFLKLCVVSVLTEGFSGNSNFNVPGGHSGGHGIPSVETVPTITPPYFGLSPVQIAVIAAIVVFAVGLGLVILYLVTRLRFALFHCLVFRTREIRPGWQLYDQQSWRFFLLSVAVGLIFFLVFVLIAIPFVLGFYRLVRGAQPGDPFNIVGLLTLLLPLIPIILLIVLIAIAVHVILHDLMLPHLALENASAADAWRQVRTRIAAEKGGFLLFAFLRVVLPLAAMVLSAIVLAIPFIVVALVFGLSAAGLSALIAGVTGATKFLFILLGVTAILILVAAAILVAVCVGGMIGIAVRNFALLFYGGRYQALGDLLSPPQPPPVAEGAGAPA